MNLYQKLIEIRKEVPYLQKDTKGYQYSYVAGSTVLGTIKKKMDELGVLLVPSVISSEMTTMEIIEKGQAKQKPTVKADMEMCWINAEKPEEKLVIPFACFGTQDDISKAFGTALTYSERYFLLKFFNIATDSDDPDAFQEKNDHTQKEENNGAEAKRVSNESKSGGTSRRRHSNQDQSGSETDTAGSEERPQRRSSSPDPVDGSKQDGEQDAKPQRRSRRTKEDPPAVEEKPAEEDDLVFDEAVNPERDAKIDETRDSIKASIHILEREINWKDAFPYISYKELLQQEFSVDTSADMSTTQLKECRAILEDTAKRFPLKEESK